ncbi:hypothetical protein Vretifemale_10665 [Volvox reticuliferus]|uniref:Uncharacterized protein n=1 Tax=Volvox reticuliferus TaxID=1737510 RepID=A0A8J4CH09_9CHLO|nr:hypothetical protein Vretifemale_10665 [Volvox reticuliferus]
MNLAVATGLTRQHQHQARQRLPEVLQGPSIPIGSPPATSSLVPSRGDVYAFPPPASAPAPGHPSVSRIGPPQPLITTPLRSQSRTLFAPQAPFAAPWISIGPPPPDSPLADVGQPVSLSAPRPLLSPDAEPAGNRRVSELLHQHVAVGSGILDTGPIAASAHDTRGPVQARPAASPEELCVELLEALACRGGGAPIGHASSALAKDTLAENHTADSNGHRGLGPGTSRRKLVSPDRVAISGGQTRVADLAAVATAPSPSPPPLPARVVANAAWSAARLVMQLWPRRQSCATEEAASPLPGRALSDISGNRLPIAGFGSQGLPQDGATRPDWVVGSNASPTLQHRSWAALRALLALVVDAAPFMEPQHLSNMLYTVARLATSLPEVLEAPCGGNSDRESSSHSDGTCAVETAETTAAEAVSATTGDAEVVLRGRALAQRLMEVLLDASLPKLSSFGPQALSNSLYAVAFLGISPPQRWLRAWLDVSARQLLRADPQHIANMLWALARLGCDPGDRWVMTALQAAALKVSAFTTQVRIESRATAARGDRA